MVFDFDSDMIFCTNQEDIVARAKYAQTHYPTIVNNVPMEKSSYTNSPLDYAKVDININRGNRVIGESSNLAQLALSYSYTFDDDKYKDLVAILSVIAQLSIDSAKKRVAIDLVEETKYLKQQLNINEIGLPKFWRNIKDNVKRDRINYELECPMNTLAEIELKSTKHYNLIPISDFFVGHKLNANRKTSKKIESLIEDFSTTVFIQHTTKTEDFNLLLIDDFDALVERLRTTYISRGYKGIISWLLNRAFGMSTSVKNNSRALKSKTEKNKSLLTKVLYETSPQSFLECFKHNGIHQNI